MSNQQSWAAKAAPPTAHQQALIHLKELYATGKYGPLGLVALSNQYPDVTIPELTQIMREVQQERRIS